MQVKRQEKHLNKKECFILWRINNEIFEKHSMNKRTVTILGSKYYKFQVLIQEYFPNKILVGNTLIILKLCHISSRRYIKFLNDNGKGSNEKLYLTCSSGQKSRTQMKIGVKLPTSVICKMMSTITKVIEISSAKITQKVLLKILVASSVCEGMKFKGCIFETGKIKCASKAKCNLNFLGFYYCKGIDHTSQPETPIFQVILDNIADNCNINSLYKITFERCGIDPCIILKATQGPPYNDICLSINLNVLPMLI
ncbi:unnamed protein product [Moneuplotes crassus]|uniref:Uncharacterized protein n=1 Tax=Euplotes crassus TaxID=5936 RepID=A0AAD2D3E2_EUPCR|nr:unnamed protein product [Moneuplotes crassus]